MRAEDTAKVAEILRKGVVDGRQPHLTITSNSMSPLLRKEDKIILTHTPISQLKPGDIITFEMAAFIQTHRFWFEENGSLRTKGDRPLQFDPPISVEKYIGRAYIRKRGDKSLDIEDGLGRWLNRHLFWLARLESRRRWPPAVHRLFHVWGRCLVIIVDIF